MKIAIIGYGRMGRMITDIARSRGHEITAIIDRDNTADFDSDSFRSSDVAIEFSVPSCGEANCRAAIERGVKVVSGTTGWTEHLADIVNLCNSTPGAALIWSSNYSIGVNLFKRIAAYTTRLMSNAPQYSPSLNEVHHIHKLDHPSGTAITLAETVIANDPRLTSWSENPDNGDSTLVITHERKGEVPGIHMISWESDADTITIEHSAKSREGFALGAVMAAEWLSAREGVHTIDEMIDEIIADKSSHD